MKKLLILCFLFIFLTGCEQQPYFDFDTVTYYHTDITQKEFADLEQENEHNPNFEINAAIIWGFYGYPRSVHDKRFLSGVEKFFPVKIEISPDKITQLQEIFKKKKSNPDDQTACEPFYRDVIIFKKSGKVTGIAKLCFGCRKSAIIGTEDDTMGFGENGDWKKLKELLSKELPKDSQITEPWP